MPPPEPGDRLDRYVIESLLGEGGMGRVYAARDERLDRRVALKVIASDVESEGRARLLREARAAAKIDHPNVVQVYDVGEADGQPFIAMELIEGRTLRSLIDAGASVPMQAKIAALRGVALALSAAHDARFVHRDVKPENVMVRPDGRVKVLDFGIVRRDARGVDPTAPTTQHSSTLTGEGVKVGTPMYMAPEQIKGDPIDGRADQFGWAVTAYELLSGKPPWTTREPMALLAAILTQEPARLGPPVPPAIADVVAKAMQKQPDDRFASMQEIVAALASSDAPSPPSPRPVMPPRSSSSPPPRASSEPPRSPPRASPAPMPTLSRRYSAKELEEILDRALTMAPAVDDTGYRYEEVAAAAREVGVDEQTLSAAMRDLVKRGAVAPPSIERRRARIWFYRHAGLFGAGFVFFFMINLVDNLFGHGFEWWFLYPLSPFLALLLVHAVFHFLPTPKAHEPLKRRAIDPREEDDARALSRLLKTNVERPRVRVAASADDEADRQAQAEAEAEAELARLEQRAPSRRHNT